MRGQFGIRSLRKRFPTEDACLEFLFKLRHSKRCSCGGKFKRVPERRAYQCGRCRTQVYPTAGTIFEKSRVPLTLWLHCMLVFSNAKCGISAKVIERDLEVTYKCAWRMLTLLRSRLPQSEDVLFGDVEVDTGYIGGKAPLERRMHNKATVFGAIQRRGQARVEVTKDASAKAHKNFIWKNISTRGTRLLTDRANRFHVVAKPYDRQAVNHSKNEYVRGDIHVNNIENFWSHVKRSIAGTHRRVSRKHLQSYLDGFVFHYNNARTDRERFFALLDTVLQRPKA
jgi:transposase